MEEDYLKIVKVISSCKTMDHFATSMKMINNFAVKHGKNKPYEYIEGVILTKVRRLILYTKQRRRALE